MFLYQKVATSRPIRAVRGKVRSMIILNLLLLLAEALEKPKYHLHRSVYPMSKLGNHDAKCHNNPLQSHGNMGPHNLVNVKAGFH